MAHGHPPPAFASRPPTVATRTMKLSRIAQSTTFENKVFIFLLVAVTLAFVWVLWPFYGAVFWGAIFAMMFRPLFLRLLKRMPNRRTLAALATLSVILVVVILPLAMIVASLVQEATLLYSRIQSGDFNPAMYFQQVYGALPQWALGLLDRFGLGSQGLILERLTVQRVQRQPVPGDAGREHRPEHLRLCGQLFRDALHHVFPAA